VESRRTGHGNQGPRWERPRGLIAARDAWNRSRKCVIGLALGVAEARWLLVYLRTCTGLNRLPRLFSRDDRLLVCVGMGACLGPHASQSQSTSRTDRQLWGQKEPHLCPHQRDRSAVSPRNRFHAGIGKLGPRCRAPNQCQGLLARSPIVNPLGRRPAAGRDLHIDLHQRPDGKGPLLDRPGLYRRVTALGGQEPPTREV